VREHWWPEYSWTKFFGFNTGYFVIMIASILAYDFMGEGWLILPLTGSIERARAMDSGISGGLSISGIILCGYSPAFSYG